MSADPSRASVPPIAAIARRPRRAPLRVPIDDVPRGSLVDGLVAAPEEPAVTASVEVDVEVGHSIPAPDISIAPPVDLGRSSSIPAANDVRAVSPPIPPAPATPSLAEDETLGSDDSVEIELGASADDDAEVSVEVSGEMAGLAAAAPDEAAEELHADDDGDVEEMDAADFVEEARADAAAAVGAIAEAAAARPAAPPAPPAVAPPVAPPAPPAPPAVAPAAARPPAPPPAPPAVPAVQKKFRNWFETFFNDDYLRTVKMPSMRAVARECDFIEKALGLAPGAQILDVGCGLGLQANELTRRGYVVVGLDLSKTMVARANDDAKDYGFDARFLHGDMREMTFDVSFDAVLCWGTSFGYFEDEVNRLVLQRMRDALREGGRLLLDVANRDFVVRSQPNLVWFEGDGCVCMEETQFNAWSSTLEVSRNVMLDEGRQREAQYAVRLYSLHELSKELTDLGFRVQQVSGSISTPGVFFGADAPRIVITAERRASGPRSSIGPMSIPPI